MYLKNIKIKNFRNYEEQEVKFGEKLNIFYGENVPWL